MKSNPMTALPKALRGEVKLVTDLKEAMKKAPSFKPLKPLQQALDSYVTEINSVMDGLVTTGMRPRDAVHQMMRSTFLYGFNAGRAYEQGQTSK
jgi:hypothetical protein